MAAHLSLAGVARSYPGVDGRQPLHALGPLDMAVDAGEFVAVVGPSGCGKSTLIDVVSGLAPASEGVVRFEDRLVAGQPPDGIGVVFQQDASFPWLTVAGNIGFGLRRRGVAATIVADKVAAAIALMGLSDFADAYPAQLSGGMRQRVCIARTLVLEPRLILLDEPFGALDAQTRLFMGDELLKLWRTSGASVVLITHSLDEAALLADRVLVMSARPGRIVAEVETGWGPDRTSALVTSPRFPELTHQLWRALAPEARHALRQATPAEAAA